MMRNLRKSKSLTCFSSIAILLFASIMPCACLAEASTAAKVTSQAHSCCDEQTSKEHKQQNDCENCSHCSVMSSHTYELIPILQVAQSDSLEQIPTIDFYPGWWQAVQTKNSATLLPPDTGPPRTQSTNSSSLAKLLHRWLV